MQKLEGDPMTYIKKTNVMKNIKNRLRRFYIPEALWVNLYAYQTR